MVCVCISLLRVSLQGPNNSRGGPENSNEGRTISMCMTGRAVGRVHREVLEAGTEIVGDEGLSRHD